MTLWDLYAAKRYLKEHNIDDANEDAIFEANERLLEIEKNAKEKTQKHKMRKSKTPKMADIKAKKQGQSSIFQENSIVEKDKGAFDTLFENIKTFNIKE